MPKQELPSTMATETTGTRLVKSRGQRPPESSESWIRENSLNNMRLMIRRRERTAATGNLRLFLVFDLLVVVPLCSYS